MATSSSSKVPVVVSVEETILQVTITADYQSSGNAVSYSGASTQAILYNGGRYTQADVEYKIGSGAWHRVNINQSANIDIDFSSQTLRLRRAKWAVPSVTVSLTIQSLPGTTLYAGTDEDVVDVGSGSPSPSPAPGPGIGLADVPAFVSDGAPTDHPDAYLWVQTGLGDGSGITFWVEDGQ